MLLPSEICHSQTGCVGQAVEPRLNPTRTEACHPDPETDGAVRPLCASCTNPLSRERRFAPNRAIATKRNELLRGAS